MKKIAMILVLSFLFSTLGVMKKNVYAAITSNNIEVAANTLNVRQEKSTKSKILCKVYQDEIYKVIAMDKDSQGRVWYKVNADFGITGWIAGWHCKKTTQQVNTTIESKAGELLYDCRNKELFVKLLLLEEYSLKNVIKVCGNNYSLSKENNHKMYQYKNGTTIELDDSDEVRNIEVGGRTLYVKELTKISGNILSQKGDEILITDGYSLFILTSGSKKLLQEYRLGLTLIEDLKVGNFTGEDRLELYVNGWDNGEAKQNIYKVIKDKFVRIYDIDSFDSYSKGIKANMNNDLLKVDINIGSYNKEETSKLPERVFYNTKDEKDKNKLLSVDTSWNLVQDKDKWYIKVRNTINIVMLTYYWGPPCDDMADKETLYNDLARIDLLLDMSKDKTKICKVNYEIKYNDPNLLNVKPIQNEEGAIVNGPELGMSMEQALIALGKKLNEEEYSDYIKLNGISLFEFCCEIVEIHIESKEYETIRGLKVGDSIEKVESLYGKPDVGFSGDKQVDYKFLYKNYQGELNVNYYRDLYVCYKDGLVSSYGLYQVILD